MTAVKCLAPWMCLILADTAYGPCCHHKFPGKRSAMDRSYADAQSLVRLFNDENMTALRRQLLDNDLPYNCKACIRSGYNLLPNDIIKVEKSNDVLEKYVRNLLSRIERGEDVDDAHPVTVHLSKDAPCNLRCTFCEGAPPRDPGRDYVHRAFKTYFETLQSIGWDAINEVYFGGGEPFFNPGLVRFIREFDWSELKEVNVATVSNATLLHKHFDVLRNIDNFYIRLSVDATGETYDRLRRGSSWNKIKANLQEMSRIMRDKPGWKVEIHSILMRSTVPFMTEMIRIAHDLGFDLSVNSIRGNYIEENIFFFQDLLDGLDWKDDLGEAVRLADEYGFDAAARTLRHLTLSLDNAAAGRKASIQTLSCVASRLDMFRTFFANLADRRFALWGTDHNLLDFLQKEPALAGLRFVTDSPDTLRTYCGYEYVSTRRLESDPQLRDRKAGEIDAVVVNAPTFRAQTAIEQAARTFPEAEILIRPYWDAKAQANMERIVASGKPFVGFGAGGSTALLLGHGPLRHANVAAIADNNADLHGRNMLGVPIVAPGEITAHGGRVVIFSEAYSDEIEAQIRAMYGDTVAVEPLF